MILLVSFGVSLDGRCACGFGHGVSAYGARDPFGDRCGGSHIRTLGHHAWRRTNLGFPDHYGAHDGALLGGRGGFGLRQSDGRIWGNNHLCGKYTGPDANAAIGDLRFLTGARGGCFCGSAFGPVCFYLCSCAGAVRMDGAARCAWHRPMTLFLDLNHSVGDFNLALKFQVPKGVSALFGRSGPGKPTPVNAVAGLITPQKGRIEIAGRALF